MKFSFKKLEELINKKLDGILTAAEDAEMEKILTGSEKARLYLEQMETMHARMSNTDFKQQQVDISRQVMKRIKNIKFENNFQKSIFMEKLTLANRQLLNYAAVLLLGLLLGSSVTYVLTSGLKNPDKELSKGLMSSHQSGSTYFNGRDWQIQANYSMIDKEINMFVSVKTAGEIQVKMQLDPQVYKILNAQCQGCSSSPEANIYSGLINFSAAGETVYKIQMKYQPGINSPVQLEVLQDGGTVFQGELIIR